MKRVGIWIVVLALAVAAIAVIGNEAGSQSDGPFVNSYTVKFMCGDFTDSTRPEGPAATGSYETMVDVRNPNASAVTISTRTVLLFKGAHTPSRNTLDPPRAPRGPLQTLVRSGYSMVFDCGDIRQALLGGVSPVPNYIQGTISVEVEDPSQLEVIATILAGNGNRVDTLDTQHPSAVRVLRPGGGAPNPEPSESGTEEPEPSESGSPSEAPSPTPSDSGLPTQIPTI